MYLESKFTLRPFSRPVKKRDKIYKKFMKTFSETQIFFVTWLVTESRCGKNVCSWVTLNTRFSKVVRIRSVAERETLNFWKYNFYFSTFSYWISTLKFIRLMWSLFPWDNLAWMRSQRRKEVAMCDISTLKLLIEEIEM